MRISERYKKIRKLRGRLRLLLGLIVILIFFLVLILLATITNLFSFEPPSYISVFNLQKDSIFVNGSELKIYDTYLGETNRFFVYNVENINSEVIKSIVLPQKKTSELHVYVNSDQKYCFFSADVTSIYYDTGDVSSLSEINYLSEIETDSVTLDIDLKKYIYLYPGKYSYNDIPYTLLDKKVIGVYPIACSDLKDPGLQIGIVNLYKTFDTQEQRDYYNTEVERLNEELN